MGEVGLRVHVLGGFQVWVDGREVQPGTWLRRDGVSLVKLLAITPGHELHQEVVADRLWPEMPRGAASNRLYKALHAARRALEPDLIRGSASRFLPRSRSFLCLEANVIDVDRFTDAARSARVSSRVDLMEDALALYVGPLLPGDIYEDWTRARRQELEDLRMRVALTLAERLAAGMPEKALEHVRALLLADPTNEGLHQVLLRMYVDLGMHAEALTQYERLQAILRQELGVEPAAESVILRDEAETKMRLGEGQNSLQLSSGSAPWGGLRSEWLRRGKAALDRYDNESAEQYLRRALAVSAEGEWIEVMRSLATVLERDGRQTEAQALYREGLERSRRLSPLARAQCRLGLARVAAHNGRWEDAVSILEQAIREYRTANDVTGLCKATGDLGLNYFYLGRYDEALHHIQEQSRLATRSDDPRDKGMALNNLGLVYWRRGEHDRAMACFVRRAALAREQNDRGSECKAIGNVGVLYHSRGEYDKAIEFYNQQMRLAEENGLRLDLVVVTSNLAEVYLMLGDVEHSSPLVERQLELALEIQDRAAMNAALRNLASLARLRGDLPQAYAYARQCVDEARHMGGEDALIQALMEMGTIEEQQGHIDMAVESFTEALERSLMVGDPQRERESRESLERLEAKRRG